MANPWDAIHANNGLEVTIHLTPEEVGNINGWVLRGFADPAQANHPSEIVLIARTRERFDDIAGQFVRAGLCEPAYWWPWEEIDAPPPPEVTLPPDTKVVLLDVVHEPDKRVLFAASADYVVAIPFDVPGGPYAITSMFSASASEYAWGGMAFSHAAINRTPGDMTGASGSMSALEVWRDANLDGAGRWYYNIRLVDGSQDRGSGFSWRAPR